MEFTCKRVKVCVFTPLENEECLRKAIGQAGGGVIGNYRYCSFVTKGTGWFEPQEGANPTIGTLTQLESVQEVKIEFQCDHEQIQTLIAVIKETHPYEEVPIEVYPMLEI